MIDCRRFAKVAAVFAVSGMLFVGCGNQEALENQEAYRQLGISKMEEGEYEDAIDAFQNALDESMAKVTDTEIDICYYKAAAQNLNGDTEGAIETYTALIEYDKENANAYYLRGSLYLQEENNKKCISDYNKAIEADTSNYEMYINIYENLNDGGYEEKALTYLEDALKIEGKKAVDYREKGRIYLIMEDYDKAKSYLEKAVDKNDVKALLYEGEMYAAIGDSNKATEMFNEYLKDNAEDGNAYNELGLIAMGEKDYDTAVAYFQQGLEIKDVENEQELRKNEIIAYEYAGDFVTAKSKMESYVADYPADEEAQREYTFLETR